MLNWKRWTLACVMCIPLATAMAAVAQAGLVQVFVEGERPSLPPQPDPVRVSYYKGPYPTYSDSTAPDHWSPLRNLAPGNWILTLQNMTTGDFLQSENFTVGPNDPPKRGYVYLNPATNELEFRWIRIVFAKGYAESGAEAAPSSAK